MTEVPRYIFKIRISMIMSIMEGVMSLTLASTAHEDNILSRMLHITSDLKCFWVE